MRLNEIFDSKYPYTWSLQGKRGWNVQWRGAFTPADGNAVDLTIACVGGDEESVWIVDFGRQHQGRSSVSATGQGDQVKILSTVTHMIKEFEAAVKPHVIRFTTYKEGDRESDSRPQLYRTMARAFAKDFTLSEKLYKDKLHFKLTRKTEFDNLSDDELVDALREEALTEVFDSSYDYDWVSQSPGAWRGDFTSGKDKITVDIERVMHNLYDVSFARNDFHNVSGEGDQVRIFSTVVGMIKEFMDDVKPNTLQFSATKDGARESRVRLYRRMASLFSNEYKVDEYDNTDNYSRTPHKVQFSMTRRDSLEETASAGATSAGSVAAVAGALGAGFSNDYSKSIYGEPTVIRRNPKPKKRKR